jgi:hypothetical protein
MPSIQVSEETKEAARKLKREDDTWDDTVDRLVNGVHIHDESKREIIDRLETRLDGDEHDDTGIEQHKDQHTDRLEIDDQQYQSLVNDLSTEIEVIIERQLESLQTRLSRRQ